MKAIRVHAPGGPEVLRLDDLPEPAPGPGQVLIRVEAAGVNFVEIYQRSGVYSLTLPVTLGAEAAGTVTAVGPGVSEVAVGDAVASESVLGAYAQLAIVPGDRVVRLPPGVSARQGAAVMLQGLTAHYLALSTYPLRPGDVCLIHAAAGGVGSLLVRVAKLCGARVIGTASTPEKAALARQAGADETILYSERDFVAEVARLTAGRGVQVVYDSVGRTTFEGSLQCLARRGMMVLFGQSSGAVAPLDPQVLNRRGSLFLTRPTLVHYVATPAELSERAGQVLAWVQEGRLPVRIWREFPLAEAAEAHRRLESRETSGKVLLIP